MLTRTRKSAHASRLQSAATRSSLSLGTALQRAMTTIAPSAAPILVRPMRISAIAANTAAAKIAQSIKAFWGDTDGVILPYVTVMLVVIVGVSVLALDGSRYMSLQTQLQNGADALALAGAAELDRTPTAIERASRAINRLVTNSSLFGSGLDRNVRVARINFLRSLPPRDSDPILPGNRTSDPTLGCVRRGHGRADQAANDSAGVVFRRLECPDGGSASGRRV